MSEPIGFIMSCEGLTSLLNLCSLKGKNISGKEQNLIESFVIIIDKKKAKVKIVDDGHIVASIINLTTIDTFKSGSLPVSITDFKTILARFKKNDELIVLYDSDESTITIMRKKPELSFTFSAISGSTIRSTLTLDFPVIFDGEIPKYFVEGKIDRKYSVRFDCNSSALSDLIKDSEITGLNSFPITFTSSDKKLICSSINNKKGSIVKREIEYESIKIYDDIKELNLTYGSCLSNVINGINGKVRVYIGNELSMLVIMETSDLSAQIILSRAVLEQIENDVTNTETEDKDET